MEIDRGFVWISFRYWEKENWKIKLILHATHTEEISSLSSILIENLGENELPFPCFRFDFVVEKLNQRFLIIRMRGWIVNSLYIEINYLIFKRVKIKHFSKRGNLCEFPFDTEKRKIKKSNKLTLHLMYNQNINHTQNFSKFTNDSQVY